MSSEKLLKDQLKKYKVKASVDKEKNFKVATSTLILSYPHLFKTAVYDNKDTKKYSCTLMIPKEDKETYGALKKAFESVFNEYASTRLKGTKLNDLWEKYLKDGDEKAQDNANSEIYKGFYLLKVKSNKKPEIINFHTKEFITDEEEIYGGTIARANLFLMAYNYLGNKGITTFVSGICKLGDGEKLGTGSNIDVLTSDVEILDDSQENIESEENETSSCSFL